MGSVDSCLWTETKEDKKERRDIELKRELETEKETQRGDVSNSSAFVGDSKTEVRLLAAAAAAPAALGVLRKFSSRSCSAAVALRRVTKIKVE